MNGWARNIFISHRGKEISTAEVSATNPASAFWYIGSCRFKMMREIKKNLLQPLSRASSSEEKIALLQQFMEQHHENDQFHEVARRYPYVFRTLQSLMASAHAVDCAQRAVEQTRQCRQRLEQIKQSAERNGIECSGLGD